jgi:DNA modification methylase
MSKLVVEYLPVTTLIPYAKNARTHSENQISEISESIREFGWTNPILISETNEIIAGHGRLMAAENLGMDTVPCIRLVGLTETQRRAYVIADNQMALNAGWDEALLRAEILELRELEFDIKNLGFSDKDLKDLFKDENEPEKKSDDKDEDNAIGVAPQRANPGDLFILGNHRLLCGDATDITHIARLTGGTVVDMILTDPPYGVSERTNRGEAGRGKLAPSYDFAPVIGDDSIDTAVKCFKLINDVLKIPLIVYWGGNYYANHLPHMSSWLVWDKREGVGQDDNADCELAWTNRGGPARVFAHLWKGAIKASERGERRVHPTQKPVALAEYCIGQFPKQEPRVVMDLFGGSGSTLIACEKMGKTCLMAELEPRYCDVILARWEKFTGKTARIDVQKDEPSGAIPE